MNLHKKNSKMIQVINNLIVNYSTYRVVWQISRKVISVGYIWCNADQFVLKNQLSGFYLGMFISEVEEAFYYNFWDLEQQTIDKSNNEFAEIVSRYINEPLDVLFRNST